MLVVAALVAAAALLAVPGGRAPDRPTSGTAPLPVAVRHSVSAALGGDDRAYRASATRDGARLTNRPHGLSARFGSSKVLIRSAVGRLGISLRGVGREERLSRMGAARPRVRANRVEYRHPGVTEWYVNGPLGLEQGFTLRRPPAPRAGPLTVRLGVDGPLAVTVAADRDTAVFRTRDGRAAIVYSGLWAADATGRELPAWLERSDGDLLIRVNDASARYPLTIDPFFQGKLSASDGAAQDHAGHSVAVAGDTVVVGAPGDDVGTNADQGSVYVFVRQPGSFPPFRQAAKLMAADGTGDDHLGSAVAILGNTIVAGAPGDDVAAADQGSALVFVRPANGWADTSQPTARFTTSSATADEELGASVAVTDGAVVVGAPGADGRRGAAYLFVRPIAGYANATETAKLSARVSAMGDRLGTSVAIVDSTAAAGAPDESFGRGAVYVFTRPATGWRTATETARLTAADGVSGEGPYLGLSVAMTSDAIVAGAPYGTDGSFDDPRAYVYVKPTTGWTDSAQPTAKLMATNASRDTRLGQSVAIGGDTVVAGAPLAGGASRGVVYLFTKPLGGWSDVRESAAVMAADAGVADMFGTSVAIGSDTIVGGAPSNTSTQAGAAYVLGGDITPPASPSLTDVDPDSPANVNSVTVKGAAEAGSTVHVYTNATCRGTPAASLAASAFASPGAEILVADDQTTTFYATATDAAANTSQCSVSSLAYREDSTPPAPPRLDGPTQFPQGTTATFTATLSDAAEVPPDGIRWTAGGGLPDQAGVTATFTFAAPGSYTVAATATDRAGNTSSAASMEITVTQVVAAPVDTDRDGVVDGLDRCRSTDARPFDNDHDGCPDDRDGDGVVDAADRCPAVSAGGKDANRDGCRDPIEWAVATLARTLSLPARLRPYRATVCHGEVQATLTRGRVRLATKDARVDRRCRYRVRFRFDRSRLRGDRTVAIRVRFLGNEYMGATTPRSFRVKVRPAAG
jgi:PKD repeat protein